MGGAGRGRAGRGGAGRVIIAHVPVEFFIGLMYHIHLLTPRPFSPHTLTSSTPPHLHTLLPGLLVQLLCDSEATRQGFTLQNPKKLGAIKAIYSGGCVMGGGAGALTAEGGGHQDRQRWHCNGTLPLFTPSSPPANPP